MSRAHLRHALVLTLAVAACRAPAPQTAWREEMASVFSDSSVRPDDPPRHLWTEADVEMLQRRLGYADCAAIGATKVVSVYSTFNSARQLAMAFHPEQILHGSLEGSLDKEGDLQLQLTPSLDDFRLAVQTQRLLPGTRYLAFLKRDSHGVWRWALYADDPQLIREVRATYEQLARERDSKKD